MTYTYLNNAILSDILGISRHSLFILGSVLNVSHHRNTNKCHIRLIVYTSQQSEVEMITSGSYLHEFTPIFNVVCTLQSLDSFAKWFVDDCLFFRLLSFGHCIALSIDLYNWLLLARKLLHQGFLLVKLKSSQFCDRYHDLVASYGISVSHMTTDMFHLS